MATVFISYAREDVETTKRVASALEQAGYAVWWDRALLPGQSFDQEIERQLAEADAVIVLWSTQSIASRWVRAEAGEALEKAKLIPIRIDDVRPPLEFRRIQTVDMVGWDGGPDHASFQNVMAGLHAIAREAPAPSRSALEADAVPPGPEAGPDGHAMRLIEMGWYYADIELFAAGYRHILRYQNHWTYETIHLDGEQVIKGGTWTSYKSIFQFWVANTNGRFLCVMEPKVEGFLDLNLARLTRLVVTLDGQVLGEIHRKRR